MHLLAVKPGTIPDGAEAVDLGQTPGDIVVLSAAETEIACLAAAQATLMAEDGAIPSLRLASLLRLRHHFSVDLYADKIVAKARLVIIRLLGGESYWPYGIERLSAAAAEAGVFVAWLPGDEKPDPDLLARSTVTPEVWMLLHGYLTEGGPENAGNFLRLAAHVLGKGDVPPLPAPLLRAGIYYNDLSFPGLTPGSPPREDSASAQDPRVKPGDDGVYVDDDVYVGDGVDADIEHLSAAPPPPPGLLPRGEEELRMQSEQEPPPPEGGGWRRGRRQVSRTGEASEKPRAAILFYRALVQAGNLRPVDALIDAFRSRGIDIVPVFVQSLKDAQSNALLEHILARNPPDIVVNATSFAVASPGARHDETVLDRLDVPVIQIAFSGSTEAEWRARSRGMDARDLAMNVVLPEVDGRIIARAISFRESGFRDPLTEADLTFYRPVPDRIDFTADLASRWIRLRRTPATERRVAFILANYPNKDGRLGNGVGLDTPAALIEALRAMRSAGYQVGDLYENGQDLIEALAKGPTNADPRRAASLHLTAEAYYAGFARLPETLRQAVLDRWGEAQADRFFDPVKGFRLPVIRLGNAAIGMQPSRGYDIDPAASYHAPDLVPPHGYIAFYLWLREVFGAHALVHMGKHGTAEWLPGKAVALSAECWPEAVMGPMPHLYPFIVNDPGEGTQAKRRAAAVIIDHLTPPLARAESYGPLARLEGLIDEYMAASGLDPRRLKSLGSEIRDLAVSCGLDQDCGIRSDFTEDEALAKLDTHLCELKEMQIRDGLHVFGRSPDGEQRLSLLVALARAPRGQAPEQGSIIRALADDLGLGIDPLMASLGDAWTRPKPECLADILPGVWRTVGDTVERLEHLASTFVSAALHPPPDLLPRGEEGIHLPTHRQKPPPPAGGGWRRGEPQRIEPTKPEWTAAQPVLDWIADTLAPAVDTCGPAEIAGLLAGLDGRFVPPGPSGAPSRGRPEVLPTGRNFYSLDTRAVPTPAAWELGWRSASALVERYVQDHGAYPRTVALSAWGTANMRTGGDDIAQALALMGVRPSWEPATGRVTGFEIMPATVLGRPRVDVTLRVSGLFRDAFPNLMDLVDAAARALADLDEPADLNPMADRVATEVRQLTATGLDPERARKRAGTRVFGSKPGAYGAGLQALIDEGGWQDQADFAAAYLAWGQWAYGGSQEGEAEPALLRERLGRVDAVLHNQDNREHDLLDSDDYYQFEGGLAATVKHLSGKKPAVYHNDHSLPESPRIRTLEEEIARVVRGRAVNPKWIAGVMRHGYKGAFEIAATVDYLFAFAATADAVRDHHFDAIYSAYLDDTEVLAFFERYNPAARAEIAWRLSEAIRRGLWRPRLNSAADRLETLSGKDVM